MDFLKFDQHDQAASATIIPATNISSPGVNVISKRRDELILSVCDAAIDLLSILFSVDGTDLRSSTRAKKHIARIRQLGMYALNVALGMKMGDIAIGFGRDRSTVVYACHLIEDMRDEPEFDAIVCRVEAVFAISFQFVPIGKNENVQSSSVEQA